MKDRTIREVLCKVGKQVQYCGKGKSEWERRKWGNMVDGLHIHTWNRTMNPLAIVLSGGKGITEGDGGEI
jgi:hypothetical protein